MSIDYDTCCPRILAEIASVSDEVDAVSLWGEDTWQDAVDGSSPWLRLINEGLDRWVYEDPDYFPSLSELVDRVTSFGIGFSTWSFFASQDLGLGIPNTLVYCLPADPGNCRVMLNSAQLAPDEDYTLSGTSLTLTHPLEYGDLLAVKSYGEAL